MKCFVFSSFTSNTSVALKLLMHFKITSLINLATAILLQRIKRRQLLWYGHVPRHDTDLKGLQGTMEGKRRRGGLERCGWITSKAGQSRREEKTRKA